MYQQVISYRRQTVPTIYWPQIIFRVEIMLGIIIFLCLVVQIWVRIATTQMAYHIEARRAELTRSVYALRDLEVAKEKIRSPNMLSREVERRLNLVPVLPQQVRRINLG
ncbi:hypothetical protein JNK13_03045 [bacterium]|nr:hypothetical protein [bacterium]